MAWATVASAALDGNSATLKDVTFRQVIDAGGLSNTGRSKTRVTFQAGTSAEGLSIGVAYIGVAGAGDAYDFAATPTQILFSGVGNAVVPASGTLVSDEIAFTVPTSGNLVISFYVANDAANDTARYKVTVANWLYYFKAGNDAATVNTSGYTTSTNDALGVSLIESDEPSAGGIPIFFD